MIMKSLLFIVFVFIFSTNSFAKIEVAVKNNISGLEATSEIIGKANPLADEEISDDNSIKDMFTDSEGNVLESSKIPSLKQTIGRWNILTGDLDGRKICYAVARPFAKVGNHKDARDAYLMVIYWNRQKQGINISMGFNFKTSSQIGISIDGKQFSSNPSGDRTIPSVGVDSEIVKTMLYGKKLLVKGDSRIFTYAVDAYNIEEFQKVYAKLIELCDYM